MMNVNYCSACATLSELNVSEVQQPVTDNINVRYVFYLKNHDLLSR